MAHPFRIAVAAAAIAVVAGGGEALAADVLIEEPVYQPVIEYSPRPYYARFDCAYAFMEEPNLFEGNPVEHFIEKNGGYVKFSDGWSCDVGLGHRLSANHRFDVTVEYRGPIDIEGVPDYSVVPTGHGQATNVDSFVTMFNAYWDITKWGGITPYVGAGLGFAYNDMDDVLLPETGFRTDGGGNFDLAWALMAGVAFDVSQDLVVDAGYRYINFGDALSGTLGSDGSIVPRIRARDLDAHEVRVGFRYDFY